LILLKREDVKKFYNEVIKYGVKALMITCDEVKSYQNDDFFNNHFDFSESDASLMDDIQN